MEQTADKIITLNAELNLSEWERKAKRALQVAKKYAKAASAKASEFVADKADETPAPTGGAGNPLFRCRCDCRHRR